MVHHMFEFFDRCSLDGCKHATLALAYLSRHSVIGYRWSSNVIFPLFLINFRNGLLVLLITLPIKTISRLKFKINALESLKRVKAFNVETETVQTNLCHCWCNRCWKVKFQLGLEPRASDVHCAMTNTTL